MRYGLLLVVLVSAFAQEGPDKEAIRAGHEALRLNYKDEAAQDFRRAIGLREARVGPDDPLTAEPITDLALALASKLDADPAELLGQIEPLCQRAIGIYEKAGHPDAPLYALTLEIEADVLARAGRKLDATVLLTRAAEIRTMHIRTLQRIPIEGKPPRSDAMRIGGGVAAPRVEFKSDPEYSEAARLLKKSGTALLRLVVDMDGKTTDIELVRSRGYGLDEQALAALGRWKFSPATVNGVPVACVATIEVNFRLL